MASGGTEPLVSNEAPPAYSPPPANKQPGQQQYAAGLIFIPHITKR